MRYYLFKNERILSTRSLNKNNESLYNTNNNSVIRFMVVAYYALHVCIALLHVCKMHGLRFLACNLHALFLGFRKLHSFYGRISKMPEKFTENALFRPKN